MVPKVNENQIIHLPVEDFSPIGSIKQPIAYQLKKTLEKNGAKIGKVIYLPPILDLARAFKANHLSVHDAFQHLRQDGYDYALNSLESPIPFWHSSTYDEQKRKDLL